MGLYDNYRLSNSTRIPEFAGSVLPELKDAKGFLDTAYTTAKDTYDKTGMLRDNTPAPISRNDAKVFKQVYGEINTALGEVKARADYEHMIPLTDKIAREAAQKLKPFGEVAAQRATEAQKVQDKELGLDNRTQQLLLARADDAYDRNGGIKADPITGVLKGNYGTIQAAKAVDLPERTDKWLKDAVAQKGGTGGAWSDGKYIYKTKTGTEVLTQAELKDIFNNALNVSPDVQAYLSQQASLAGWEQGTNAKNFYKTATPETKAAIDKQLAAGRDLRTAVEAHVTENTYKGLRDSMSDYGSKKYDVNNYTSERDLSVDGYGLRTAEDAASTPLVLSSSHAAVDLNKDESLEDVNTRIQANTAAQTRIAEDLTPYYQVQNGKLTVDASGNFILKAGISPEMSTTVSGLVAKYSLAMEQVQNDTRMKTFARDQATQSLTNKDQTTGGYKTYKELEEATRLKLAGAFEKSKGNTATGNFAVIQTDEVFPSINILDPLNFKNVKAVAKKSIGEISKAELASALRSGNATVAADGDAIIMSDGRRVIGVSGFVDENGKQLRAVRKQAETNFAASRKNFGLSTFGLGLVKQGSKDQVTPVKEEIKSQLRTNPASVTIMDNAGAVIKADDVNWGGDMTIGDIGPGLGNTTKIWINAMKNGVATPMVIVTDGSGNLPDVIADMASKSSDIKIKSLANALKPGSWFRKLQMVDQGVPIPVTKGINSAGQSVPIPSNEASAAVKVMLVPDATTGANAYMFQVKDRNGKMVILNQAGSKTAPYTTTSVDEASQMMEQLISQYETK